MFVQRKNHPGEFLQLSMAFNYKDSFVKASKQTNREIIIVLYYNLNYYKPRIVWSNFDAYCSLDSNIYSSFQLQTVIL